MRLIRVLSVLALLAPHVAAGQAREVVEPPGHYLLEISQQWARRSELGDLRARSMAADDIELRFWEGYGLGGTRGVVVQRIGGRWRVWRAEVKRCHAYLPVHAGDTLSDSARAQYEREALAKCDNPRADPLAAATVIRTHKLVLTPRRPPAAPDSAWQAVVRAGVRRLPAKVPRTWAMLDGHTYVVEVRLGDSYRASVIEHVEPPEAEADRLVQTVAASVRRHYGWR